jgi:hypothetical protein
MSRRTGSGHQQRFSVDFWNPKCWPMAYDPPERQRTRPDVTKESWLKMSESWLRMLHGTKRRAHEHASDVFDAEQSKRGTGQDDSGSSH